MAEPITPPRASSPADQAYVDIESLVVGYGKRTVLDALSLRMSRGEFVSLLGPSGCGKTTLLRVIAGLISPTSGRTRIEGQDIDGVPVHRRGIGVVFQNYALFPNLDVAGNIAFGLRAHGVSKHEIADKVRQSLAMVRMSEYAYHSVTAISGGQQQRVAVARALAVQPRLLLLDEPFSALDRQLRETMQIELRGLLRSLKITAIFVTHDQDEALLMSDRIAVMREGRIEQFAPAAKVYSAPSTPFVLDFVGLATKFRGRVLSLADGVTIVDTAAGRLKVRSNFPPGAAVLVAVRAERVNVRAPAGNGGNAIALPLAEVIYRGSRCILQFRTAPGDQAVAEVSGPVPGFQAGEVVTLSWAVDDTLVYPAPAEGNATSGTGHA